MIIISLEKLFFAMKFIIVSFLIFLLAACSSADQKNVENFSIYGKWIVEDVRIYKEKTLLADDPPPKLHDKNYIGKTINIARDKITTELMDNNITVGIYCIRPVFGTREQYFAQLLHDTITQGNFPYGSPGYPDVPTPAVYQLQSLTTSPVQIITVICGQGEFGNPADYGMKPLPLRMNWLIRIDDRHLALHWYVDSILILRRSD